MKKSPAAAPVPSSSSDILAAVKRSPDGKDANFSRYAEVLFRRVAAEDLAVRSSSDWIAMARGLYALMQTRKSGKSLIRVFAPDAGADGWTSPCTVVQIVNDDMPFLVDTASLMLAEAGLPVHLLLHPVLPISRDARGKLIAVGEGKLESLIHIEIDRLPNAASAQQLETTLREALDEVRASVQDWATMRDRMLAIANEFASRAMPIDATQRAEAEAFLCWAAGDHFTFLGYREYRVVKRNKEDMLEAVADSGLGLLRRTPGTSASRPIRGMAAHEQTGPAQALILTKTNSRSRVHRAGYMDYIGVLRFDAKGTAIAEERFLGLYTSSAYGRRPWDIPLVRERFAQVMTQSGLGANSHSGKALKHIIESLPRDELFQSSSDELLRTSMGVLGLQERPRSRLFLRRDRFGRFFSALVYIPRDRFNTDNRQRIEALLKDALHGERIDTTIQVGESPLAQLHLIVRPKAGIAIQVDETELEAQIAGIVRNWQDELRDELIGRHGESAGAVLLGRYGADLPASYVDAMTPAGAIADFELAERLQSPNDLELRLYRPHAANAAGPDATDSNANIAGEHGLRFKLLRKGDAVYLSDALPMMENMGLRILSEHPYAIRVGEDTLQIQDFEVAIAQTNVDLATVSAAFEEAFERVWRGDAESDGFNRLILSAGMDWRQVAMLRGYCKYLLQTGVPFSQAYMETTLNRYPLIARLLVELFESRFDPGHKGGKLGKTGKGRHDEAARRALQLQLEAITPAVQKHAAATLTEQVAYARGLDREAQIDACHDALAILLEDVASLDEDRILRSFMGVIDATLRTSFYQLHPRAEGVRDGEELTPREYIAFKFDAAKVPELPKPRPYREIWVYSPRVEGVHLRFGPVARGGLRWSDRREDFRTEVLGLVKAQMVKNTVIVPVGAKGGFYVKRPPAGGDRDAQLAEGIACYKLFINALLDITDNLVDGRIAHPQQVVRHDGDDPYLVVAADKGTATFSDIANGIAIEHGFWLGDAFASGGSVGYDHKAMGITAKGAWESVKRHFRALSRDCQNQDFTCVGIGDMSGDVFGNGMLLSGHIRLLAAFDHRHIFLDPAPDAAISFSERERMFKLPRSSWEDYDKSLISKGGGVFPRSAKSIPVSPAIRQALALEASIDALSPNELMHAILKAPVDLLWNGGIGTYVKSSSESHAEVGDRANNALRVDGIELRCKVVGEGGNLGLTQRGRIEAAQAGVMLNTDFIDNSAGVDTSDHEVNIKILLNDAVQRGELSETKRNALLAKMTDEVGALVLNDNYRQNQAISVMERMSVSRLGSKQHFIRTLEAQGLLDRQLEFLPSDAEFAERKARGQGLPRPVLAILLSYAKIVIFQQLLNSDVPEDSHLSAELARYFPEPLRVRYAEHMQRHRLRREIIATAVTNSMVNRMGATFLLRMQEDTGETPAQIAKAYAIGREVLDARHLWMAIDALDGRLQESDQIDALLLIWNLQRGMTRWLLNRPGERLDIAAAVQRYKSGMDTLRANLERLLPSAEQARLRDATRHWAENGFAPKLAAQLATLPYLGSALDIIEVALERRLDIADVAHVYFQLGDALHLKWLLEQIEQLPVEGRWHAHARGVLRDELQAQQSALVAQVLSARGARGHLDGLVDAWLARDDATMKYTLSMFADLRTQRSLDYPTVSVAVRRLAQTVAADARG